MISFPRAFRKAAIESIAVTFGLLPLTLLARLVKTVGDNKELDAQLRAYPIYNDVIRFMEQLMAKATIGLAALLLFGFLSWLAYLAYAKSGNNVALNSATLIPRLVLGLAIPSVLSLFAFAGGLGWDTPTFYAPLLLILFVGFVSYFLVHLCEGPETINAVSQESPPKSPRAAA